MPVIGGLHRTLKGKAALFILLLSVIGLGTLAAMFLRTQREMLAEFEAERMQIVEHFVMGTLKPVMLTGHADLMSGIMASLHSAPGVQSLAIVRTNGIEAFTDDATMKKVNDRLGENRFSRILKEPVQIVPAGDPMLKRAVESGKSDFVRRDVAGDGTVTSLMYPIANEEPCHACHGDDHKVRGVLVATFGLSASEAGTLQSMFWFSGIAFVLLLLTAALTYLFIVRIMAGRVSNIVDQVNRIVEEDRFDKRIVIDADDEVGQLAISFNHFISSVEIYRIEEGREKERLEQTVFERTRELREKNDFIESDLKLARRIQQNLMPEKFPTPPEADFHAAYLPCLHIGGDYYDVFEMPNRHVGVFMADASGHGSSAALLVSIVKAIVSTAGKDISSPSYVVQIINNTLAKLTPDDSFVTLFYGVINLANGKMSYSLAGHPPPMVYNRDSGELQYLQTNGSLVGVFDFDRFEDSEYIFQHGDRLLVFTDGLVEAMGEDGKMFGRERLAELFKDARYERPDAMTRHLLDSLASYTGGAALADDVTLLVVDYKKG